MTSTKDTPPAQLEFFAIPSPCIGVCQSGPRGYCMGCFRSRDERLYWQKIDDDTKRKIIAACHRRKQSAMRKKLAGGQDSSPQIVHQADLFESDEEVGQKG